MIDVSKCTFEETYTDGECECDVYYFVYPKDFGELFPEEDYGNVVSMCLSLTVWSDGQTGLQISPTVEEGDCLSDIDWRDLRLDIDYTEDTIQALLNLAKRN